MTIRQCLMIIPHNCDQYSIYNPLHNQIMSHRILPDDLTAHRRSVANFAQMRPFFERLEAGLPVTVLAIGDSITSDFGGCFHRDRWAHSSAGLGFVGRLDLRYSRGPVYIV